MKKKLIALAVAAAMAPALAAAEGASVSGYTDVMWIHDNDTNLFWATAEIDFRNTAGDVTVGLDLDVDAVTGALDVEQAFFAWGAAENVTVIAGKFNNPIGMDAEDTLDQPTTEAGLIYSTLANAATALHAGNNVSGLAVAYNAGVATITVGLLNEITGGGNVSQQGDNSIALVVNASPIEGLDLEFGYVTIDNTAAGLGDSAWDLNASFNTGPITVTAEILAVDALNDELYGLGAYYDVMEGTQVGVRYESNDNADATQINFIAWHDLADNLTLGLGYNINEVANADDENVIVEFLAKF